MAQTSPDGRTHHVVRLCGFPLRLFATAEEHWDAMLREYYLRQAGGVVQPYDDADITRAGQALRLVTEAVEQVPVDAGTDEQGAPTLLLPVADPSDFVVLQGVLRDARRLAESGELLGFPTLPEVADLRNWLCDEVIGQVAGEAPTPWHREPVRVQADEASPPPGRPART
jgi:hypothetical protein